MDKDEIAFKIVELYVSQVADAQEKRKMGLDTIMNAYFYALLRLTRKEKEMEAFEKAVSKEEKFMKAKEEQEELPKMEDSKKAEDKGEEFIFD